MNNNNPAKSFGAPSAFINSGAVTQSVPVNNQPAPLLSQSQSQTQGGPAYPGHFQLSEPQAQVLGHSQYVQGSHAQFQPQVQSSNHSITQLQNPNSNNAGISSSPTVSAAGTNASAKRATQKPPSRLSGVSSNAHTASPFKTMELTPAARRKKPKLPEKEIPDKVAAIFPESSLYTQMLEFEARIDSAMARKKTDIQESLKNPSRIRKILRVYIFNTFENQAQGETNNPEPPSWSLKIVGRILEDGKDPILTGVPQKTYSKFSSYFKRITIYLDQTLYPDNHVILWESVRSPVLNEGFEVMRKGDKEFTAIIRLEMNYVPEKFKLSLALSEILGLEVETRSRILVAFWHYVKSKKLQIPNDPSFFMCDPPLRKLFGEEKVKFATVSQKISQHLTPPQPIHLEHRIKLSGTCPAGTTCYDILVDVPSPLKKDLAAFLASTEKHKEIDACDQLMRESIKKIYEHRRRRAFFLSFSQSPAEFINTLIASQSKELKLVSGDASHHAEKEHRSDFYHQSWVEDAVIRYLNRKSAGNDTPGST